MPWYLSPQQLRPTVIASYPPPTLMSSRASVEIWGMILEYAIHVPLFLNSNPLESYDIDILEQYSYQTPYWQSERVRNSLQRVCSTWNAFLKTYNHRFIRMEDVLSRRVPVTALSSAIRIDLTIHCRCAECTYLSFKDPYTKWMVDTWITGLWGKPGQSKKTNWKLEILEGWLPPRSEYATTLKRVAPRLKVMLGQPTSALTLKEDALPNLGIMTSDMKSLRPFVDPVGLTSLTVLHIVAKLLGPPLDKNDFTALRHLTIDLSPRGATSGPSQKDLRTFLRGVGPQLETLYYRQWLRNLNIEPDIWNLLPEVKRIQLPYAWNTCELPPYHPLQHVQISNYEFRSSYSFRQPDLKVQPFIPVSTTRTWKVRFDTTWTQELNANSKFIVWVIEYCDAVGTIIVDAHGSTFAAYIVFLIKAFWKQPGRKYRVPGKSGCPQKTYKKEMKRRERKALRTKNEAIPANLVAQG